RHHGRERSLLSLLAGQPVGGRVTPAGAVRVLADAGYNAGWVERGLHEIHALLLPAVLLLNDGSACILKGRLEGTPARCLIVTPGTPERLREIDAAELDAQYAGSA